MTIRSLQDVATDAAEILDGLRDAQAAIRAGLVDGSANAARLNHLAAGLGAHRGDIRALRSELDVTQVAEFQLYERGETTIALWAWERGLRHQLLRVEAAALAAEELADDVALGLRERVHIVRAGETLQAIAAKLLGDWREWTRIAEANSLTPGAVAAGTVLVIPDRR